LVGELAVCVGCAAMGGFNTEGDWLGYQFVLLILTQTVAKTAAHQDFAN